MGLFPLLLSDPAAFFVLAVVLLYSIIFHEVAHGWVAHVFGDDTALINGRLTLHPRAHIDPVGALMLFLVGFGWARPVPVDYFRLLRRRWAFIAVALAGCVTNILMAAAALALLHFEAVRSNSVLSTILPLTARINLILGAFNLIPIPPLDGSKVVMSFLPARAQVSLARLEPYGFIILIVFLFTGMLDPVITFMQQAILVLIAALFSLWH